MSLFRHVLRLTVKQAGMESIFQVVQVKARPANVIKALTTQEGLEGWWTNKVSETGQTHWRFHFPGAYSKLFKITRADKEEVSWQCIEGTPEWVGTQVHFRLMEDGDDTALHFTHSGWKETTPLFGICNYHWALYMKSLKDLVETGKGQPTQVDQAKK